jgi:sulfur carrier protein ThiS adenylyltransferase
MLEATLDPPGAEVKEAPLQRDSRQRSLVPPENLEKCLPIVIGVGAGGRQTALQLAALGAKRIVLFDHDIVAIENLAPQGYWPDDINWPKVKATADLCGRINPDCEVTEFPEKFTRASMRDLTNIASALGDLRLAVFCCVDSIETRKMIWDAVKQQISFFVDGRMASETLRILAVDKPYTDKYYETTLFGSIDAYSGSCTARATIYTASISAGLMLHQFSRWLRHMAVAPDQLLNLLSSEMTTDVE